MRAFFLTMAVLVAACSTEPSAPAVPLGRWGGTNVELEVLAEGASATFKCGALGALDEPLWLDAAGRFDVSGTYDPKLVLGGPRGARYRGTVQDQRMSLTIDVDGDTIGPYSLTLGAQGTFDVCNF